MAGTNGDEELAPHKAGADRSRWAETALIWFAAALGGVGLWVSAADPIFGGPDAAAAALTMFGFLVALAVAITALIWWWPSAWERWFRLAPSEGGAALEAAKMINAVVFWGLALALVVGVLGWQWRPVTVGAAGGVLILCRLGVDLWLHHRLGNRPGRADWRRLAEAGRKLEAVTAYRRETALGPAEAKDAVESYLRSQAEDQA